MAGADPLRAVLQFLSTIAHELGRAILAGIQTLLPHASLPDDLVDPVGFLAVLTLFVVLAGVARRIAWIVVVTGWVLLAVRIALILAGR
ncbi:MAG: hypothetical protein QN174_02995 [Armatimonadota bacterium]|nr:hypothetical protein [Armatimonadota bacterium]MDR7453826.1 hypothetical protein [Armatimonadota bacterium]MDR7456427.1 hypothetical protein [Armatimonadota bacterium]MDR7495917.1 hypothetical protein [Armatimonadota bacterium]MDR7511834.1 hypothetical protein [Armatimonadota bacterium]